MWPTADTLADVTIIVRRVRPEEFTAVGELTIEAYDAVGRIVGPYRDQLVDTGERVAAGAEVWVAVEGDRLHGSVTYVDADNVHFENHGGGDCSFRMLAVDVGAQRRGVGRTLVETCIATARDRGNRRIAIYSMEWMPTAHRLYRAMGFTRRPDRDVTFPAGVGVAFQLDLTDDADEHFPPPRPIPAEPPWYLDAWAAEERGADV